MHDGRYRTSLDENSTSDEFRMVRGETENVVFVHEKSIAAAIENFTLVELITKLLTEHTDILPNFFISTQILSGDH